MKSDGFTLLAPSNDAFARLKTNMTDELFTVMLEYSMLRGTFPRLSLTKTNTFVASHLENSNYANVTGGQVVGLSLDDEEKIQVLSGNKSLSAVSETVNILLAISQLAVSQIREHGI